MDGDDDLLLQRYIQLLNLAHQAIFFAILEQGGTRNYYVFCLRSDSYELSVFKRPTVI